MGKTDLRKFRRLLRHRHRRAGTIIHAHFDRFLFYLIHLHPFHIDPLYIATAPAHGFDADAALGPSDHAVMDPDVTNAAGHSASDCHCRVPAYKAAIFHLNLFAGTSHSPSVLVHPGIDGNAVIAGVKGTVLNEYLPARVRIAAIGIRSLGVHCHPTHHNILTIHRVDRPLRSVLDRKIFQRYVLTIYELDERGTERILPGRKYALFYHNPLTFRPDQAIRRILLELFPVPPRASRTV
nr:hypothetical protein [Roseburia hominis]